MNQAQVNELELASRSYKILFLLENLLRRKINSILIVTDGDDYLSHRNLVNNHGDHLVSIAKKRQREAIKNKIPRSSSVPLIYFLDLWHLGLIIDKRWEAFRSFFPGDYELKTIRSRFSMLSPVRNQIAHTQEIRSTEFGLLQSMLDYFARHFEAKTIEELMTEFHSEIPLSPEVIQTDLLESFKSCINNTKPLPENWMNEYELLTLKFHGTQVQTNAIFLIKELLKDYNKYSNVPRGIEKMKNQAEESDLISQLNSLIKLLEGTHG